MNWWLKSRRDRPAWLLVFAGTALIPIFGGLAMPVLRLGLGPAPFSILLPALLATGVIGIVSGGSPVHEALARRPTGLLSRLTVVALLGAPTLIWAVSGALFTQGDLPLIAIRNLVGYLGVGFIALRLVGGTAGAATPVLYAVVVAVLGSETAGTWSWPLLDSSDRSGLTAAAALFVVGLAIGVGRRASRTAFLRTE